MINYERQETSEKTITLFIEDIVNLKGLTKFHARLIVCLMKVVDPDQNINLKSTLSESLATTMGISVRYLKTGIAELLEAGLLIKPGKRGVYRFSGPLPSAHWEDFVSAISKAEEGDTSITVTIRYPLVKSESHLSPNRKIKISIK
jgi:hypothetical protein